MSRTEISSHVSNDRPELYSFVRDSKLPHGTFDRRRISVDGWVCIACMVLALALIGWTGVL